MTWTNTYEANFGQVASVSDPLGHATRFSYNTLCSLISVADA